MQHDLGVGFLPQAVAAHLAVAIYSWRTSALPPTESPIAFSHSPSSQRACLARPVGLLMLNLVARSEMLRESVLTTLSELFPSSYQMALEGDLNRSAPLLLPLFTNVPITALISHTHTWLLWEEAGRTTFSRTPVRPIMRRGYARPPAVFSICFPSGLPASRVPAPSSRPPKS